MHDTHAHSRESAQTTDRIRKHLYLVVDHPDEELSGKIRATEKRYARPTKNTQAPVDKRNLETGETYVEQLVGLGYHDFESEADYEERLGDVAEQKLGEIDERHLRNAGLDPEEVLA
ncbi:MULTISPECIES: hypothetical protein [Halorussus]|uniref:hypothetical protein n=1 Tax=Halorussus TaxID=1070314 RepID=UPI00209F55B8|nr:hypothetical protein [Halorussus vallis]USZ78729.1 hypothetical protein NGM07_24775 [Halorussus vallis]